MNNAPHNSWRRWLLTALVVAMLAAPSCAPGFDPPSKVSTLRILAVTIDKPYALPGDEVTMRMTVHDGLASDPGDPTSAPRTMQVVWLAGCFDPEGDQFFLCFEQLAELLRPLASGGLPPLDLVKLETVDGSTSGSPDALEFSFTLPDDIVSRRPKPAAGPYYGIAYVFFAACAGRLEPAELVDLGGEVPEFPLQCFDARGNKLGPDSFIIGYTQVYAFDDGRLNDNPPMGGITLDGVAINADPALAPSVPACPVSDDERRAASCGSDDPTDDCTKYQLKAMIAPDVAEDDPGAFDADGKQLKEVVWVSYFADGGTLDPSLALVNDATKGFQDAFDSEWIPPSDPGLYSIWAVVRDQRGGSTIVRRQIQVE